jgi:glycosyltransferase involved in cell wall biosynthesis
MRIGIDATNIGGGGGVTHLIEILSKDNSKFINNLEIIVFSSKFVLDQLPDSFIISKCTFPELNKGLFNRVLFQIFKFDAEIKKRCDILFSVTGDYFGNFRPLIGMSQNMLLYERNNWKEIKQLKEIFRFWLNFQKQKYSFKNSAGIIFLSNFAREYISNQIHLGNKKTEIIHHGISSRFKGEIKDNIFIDDFSLEKPFKFLYVSTVHTYKHQWNIVKAIGRLRSLGYPIIVDLVGGVIFKPSGKLLKEVINEVDPNNKFINFHGNIPYREVDHFYKNSDGIIFASTCENMPNILIESMASGRPIACSKKQPMPEFLKDNGFYFDAYNIDSIVNALEELLLKGEKRSVMSENNLIEVKNYSWEKTAMDTFKFINLIYKQHYNV